MLQRAVEVKPMVPDGVKRLSPVDPSRRRVQAQSRPGAAHGSGVAPMQTKLIEIRDRASFVPAMAIRVSSTGDAAAD